MNPSLLIIPDRYKAAKLYSQLPESGAGDFVVTRGTTATRTNASGLLESVASGVPRLDYQGGGCPALLVEPAATNQIRNNTMVGAVAGTPGTLPTNWIVGSQGLTREIISIGTEQGVQYIDFRFSGTATGNLIAINPEPANQISASFGQSWSNSAFIKVLAAPAPPLSYALSFREALADATLVAFESVNISPTSVLQRYSATRVLTGATTVRVQPQINAIVTSGQSYDFTIRIGWPQMELGSVATSAIKTTGTAATRNADVISLTGASGLIGQTQGTLYAEVSFRAISQSRRVFAISDNSLSNRILIAFQSTNVVRAVVTVGGVNLLILDSSVITTGIYKIAFAYAANNFALYVNGNLAASSASGSVPACNTIFLGKQEDSTSDLFLNDRIRAAAIYTSRLSNSELAAITTL